ncbi:MAG: HlyD family secretion protein [Reichenbachiella sp.]
MIKQNIIVIVWVLVLGFLVYIATQTYDSTSSILAQVEPQKHAISFHKPVRVTNIYVIPGQRINKGDTLISVERQDLLLEVEKKKNDIQNLDTQIKMIQVENQYIGDLAKIDFNAKSNNIDLELKRLELLRDHQNEMSKSIAESNLWNDSIPTTDQSYISMRIELLLAEKANLASQKSLNSRKLKALSKLKIEDLQLQMTQLKDELKLLITEESQLVQISHKEGTIGTVMVEKDELIPAFSTLISIYDHNPSVIRAIVSEHQPFNMAAGTTVFVESTNRRYQVEGVIAEIGSRIIEYPSRLKPLQQIPAFGREIFISIPETSNFLHGEKVYVKTK